MSSPSTINFLDFKDDMDIMSLMSDKTLEYSQDTIKTLNLQPQPQPKQKKINDLEDLF